MKIKQITIDNFKSLVDFKLDEPNPFTVFVGANGVGKSNIFEALEYLNYKKFNNWDNTDELFGGYKNFTNYNNYKNRISLTIKGIGNNLLSLFKKPTKEYYEFEDGEYNESLATPSDEGEFYDQFIKNFSRIFITSKDENKLNLSSSDKKLNFNCDNLENVLKRILNESDKNVEIREWLDLLRPGFSDIKIETDLSNKPILQLYELGYEKPFGKNLISDGTFNILCLLCAVYQTDEPQFICIEEPENGLNPYAIKELIKFFRTKCNEKGHYIWLNTHSQTIVNLLEPQEIIVINKKDGITIPTQLKNKNMQGLPMDEAWLTNVLGGGIPW